MPVFSSKQTYKTDGTPIHSVPCFCFTAFTDQIRAPFLASSVEYQFQEHLPVRASVNIRESNPAVASCDASWHATRFQSRETQDGAICFCHFIFCFFPFLYSIIASVIIYFLSTFFHLPSIIYFEVFLITFI